MTPRPGRISGAGGVAAAPGLQMIETMESDMETNDMVSANEARGQSARRRIFDEIDAERARQDAKWGEQNHPMVPADIERDARAHNAEPQFFACHVLGIDDAKAARGECERAHRLGYGTYTHILVEEVAEFVEACVLHGETSDEARKELVQFVAVGVAMLETIDRRRDTEVTR